MSDFKDKMNDKIKKYSKKEYLDGYIKDEFLTDDGDADIYLHISEASDLFDLRTSGNQIELNKQIYEFIEDKTSMLDNDMQIDLHITGLDLESKEEGMVKHIIKEHYAIELYKIQKEYVSCRNRIIGLFTFGLLMLLLYFALYELTNLEFLFEVMGFLFSFSLWEGFDAFIYSFSEIKYQREAITQNLLMSISFE